MTTKFRKATEKETTQYHEMKSKSENWNTVVRLAKESGYGKNFTEESSAQHRAASIAWKKEMEDAGFRHSILSGKLLKAVKSRKQSA